MSSTESRDKLERIRQAREGDNASSDGPEIFTCPVEGCTRTVVGNPTALRSHVHQSNDADHRGLKLDSSLELVERYKIESDLREQYVEEGKSQEELAEEWGCSAKTIRNWLNKNGIESRRQGRPRAEYATYVIDDNGYERWSSRDPDGGTDHLKVHQLLACLENDPAEVFGGDTHCHHRTPIPWLNFPENIVQLSPDEHQRIHLADNWTEEDGFPVLVTQQWESEAEYHATWHSGYTEPDPTETTSASAAAVDW